MSQIINVGNQPNDGLGDKLRVAFIIVNENFLAIDTLLSGSNVLTISQITGLQTALNNIQNQLDYIPGLQSDINSINSTIFIINQTLNSQNNSIADLYTEITNLQAQIFTKIEEAPIDGQQYVRQDGEWTQIVSATPSLQEVLDFNHDLVDGIFTAGTNAALNNNGESVIAIGTAAALNNNGEDINALGSAAGIFNNGNNVNAFGSNAGQSNQADNVNSLGYQAGISNTGENQNALGELTGAGNTGNNQNAMGYSAGLNNQGISQNAFGSNAGAEQRGDNQNAMGEGAGYDNQGNNQNAFGAGAGFANIGENVNALGSNAGSNNTGNNVNAFGIAAGDSNAFDNVNLFGRRAQATADGQTVLSKDGTIMARINTNDLTDSREYDLQDKDGTIAHLDDIPTNTSQLVNDGEDGTSPFVTLDQLPSNLSLFATNASSDIATYFKLITSIDDPDYNTTPVDISTGAITTTGQFIAALATEVGVLIGNPGIINLTTVGNIQKVSGTGDAEFYYEVYHRNSGGTETLVATSNATAPVTVDVYTEFIAIALLNNGTFLPTDRIVIKYYANRVGTGSNPEYEFEFGGTNPVRTTFPVPASNLPFSLDTLSDVTISGATAGQVLSYDGSEWENKTIPNILGYIPLPTSAATATGVTLSFITDTVYGTLATPETGNITADVTGAQLGVTNIIIHNSGTEPTFSSEFKKLSGSSNYAISQVNYISTVFISTTEIIYSINQAT